MNNYETVFITSPVLSDVQVKETVQKFKKLITDAEGKMVHEENWGLRKLAYPIKNKATGFYFLFQFQAEGDFIGKYEKSFKHDEQILRFLTVKLEKYSLLYAEKRANLKKEAKKEEEATKKSAPKKEASKPKTEKKEASKPKAEKKEVSKPKTEKKEVSKPKVEKKETEIKKEDK